METKKIGLLVMSLLIMISGGIFAEVKNAEACVCWVGDSCLAGCDRDRAAGTTCSDTGASGHACVLYHSLLNHSVCAIDPWAVNRKCVSTDSCTISGSFKYCSEDKCRTAVSGADVDDSSTNGKVCTVTTDDSNPIGGGYGKCGHSLDGRWDNFDKKCVLCGGDSMDNTEVGIYGDSLSTYVVGSSPYTISAIGMARADDEFESACGADASCDEKSVGNACNTTGACDKNGICCMPTDYLDAGNNCVTPTTCTEGACDYSTQSICDGDGNWITWDTTGSRYCLDCTHCGDGVENCGERCDKNDLNACDVDEACDDSCNCIEAAGRCDGEVQQNTRGDETTISETFQGNPSKNFNMGFLDPTSDHYVTSYADGERLVAYAEVKFSCTDCKAIICLYSPSGNSYDGDVLGASDASSERRSSPESGIWTYVLQYKKDGSDPSCPAGPVCDGTECCLTKVNVAEAPPDPPDDPDDPPDDCTKTEDPRELTCDDGIDNDCDGFFDCDDLDCVGNPVCDGGGEGGEEGGDPVVAPCGLGTGELCNPLADRTTGAGWASVTDIAQGMLNYLLGLVGSIALLFLIIAGVMYMTAGGSEEKITTAKKILTGAIIGLAIVLLAYSLLAEVNKILSP